MPNNPKGRGVLPVSAAATKKPFKQAPRAPAPRLRLIVRRLPPGLTESEFWTLVGKEWQLGQGKVDWAAYKPGKLSKDLAKPSRPSRAYLKVKDLAQIDLLSAHIRSVNFQDAKNSFRDPCLIGMPSLEFAPYNKIPSGRARHDGRQGTIDQDPEFIDFLQSLTEPITKSAANGEAEAKLDKVTTTPLVQYIKEKKANKAKEKEVAAAKAGKKADPKDAKTATPSKSEQQQVIKKGSTSEAEKARVAKATQDVVKAINTLSKSAAAKQQAKPTTAKQETPAKEPPKPTATQSTPKRERQRGDANAAARIISRDLGLTPKEGRSTKGAKAGSAPVSTPSTPTTATPSTPKPAAAPTPSPAQPPAQPPTGPRNLRNATPQPSPLRPPPTPPAQQPTPKSNAKVPPQPSSGAKSAFLKHANPSQGITEELLRTTFSVYGTITRCEIDKKKGLGYLDFTEPEALKKAMAASPVKIANGSVVVLENRSPYRKTGSQSAGSAKGNIAASTSTSVASSPKVAQASLTSISEAAAVPMKVVEPTVKEPSVSSKPLPAPIETAPAPSETTEVPSTPISPTPTATPGEAGTPPSAPRGSGGGRGGRGHHRGRGGPRGRGGYRGGNRAASNATGNGTSAPSTPTASTAESKG